jgi:hypothetical protein
MKRTLTAAALALAIAGSASSALAQTVVSADITANTTWGGAANPSPIILDQTIFVKNNATLTILPGTIVRGQPRQGPVIPGSTVGAPGALIVTQAGRINAAGSATNPIIFTTAALDANQDGIPDDVDGNPGFKDPWTPAAGLTNFFDNAALDPNHPPAPLAKNGRGNVQLWGGLVILGNAPTNLADRCGLGFGKCTVEGLTVPGYPVADCTYGGVEPHDNSGILRFASLRFAGDEIGNSNELNGLSLAGVGDGTTIDFVEIYVNFDDGFEWFGGTVNGSHLVVFFEGDDMFDLDEGYTGVNQFLFGVMPFFNEVGGNPFGSASGDKAGEFDGDNYRPDQVSQNENVTTKRRIPTPITDPNNPPPAPTVDVTPNPLSAFAMYNMTIIGSTPGGTPAYTPDFVPAGTDQASTNRGLQWRNGAAGNVFNSIVTNTGLETGIEVDTGLTGAPGFNAIDNAQPGVALINLVCSTLANGAAPAAQETLAITNGDALNLLLGGTAAGADVVNNAGFNNLIKRDQSFDPTGSSACPGPLCGRLDASLKVSPLNPRPAAGFVGVAGCVAPQGPGLDRSATYRGAFASTAPTLWTTGWTAMNRAGLLAN